MDQSLCVPWTIIVYVVLLKQFCDFLFPDQVQRRWISPCMFPGRLSFISCYWNIFVIFCFQTRSRGGGSVPVCSQDDYLLYHVIETFLWFSVSRPGPEEVDQSLCVPRTIIFYIMLLKHFCDFPFQTRSRGGGSVPVCSLDDYRLCHVIETFLWFSVSDEVQRRWISPCVFPGWLSFMPCYWNIFVIFRFQRRSRRGGSVLVCPRMIIFYVMLLKHLSDFPFPDEVQKRWISPCVFPG